MDPLTARGATQSYWAGNVLRLSRKPDVDVTHAGGAGIRGGGPVRHGGTGCFLVGGSVEPA